MVLKPRTPNKRNLQVLIATSLIVVAGAVAQQDPPNVIVILTDDQGYGDLSVHGNPVLQTPELDQLHSESVRFTDFHVAPVCTPSRAQLMTGVDAMKTGATWVCQGRSMIRREVPTLANYFAAGGYATGLFGKWHLGDTYPHRPEDRGFQEVLSFRAWGLPSLASNWENSTLNHLGQGDTYTDPMLSRNGVEQIYPGYCTDIYFDEAMAWMLERKTEDEPFFLYLPTNTPHGPDFVPSSYSSPYVGTYNGITQPAGHYGMIANIDENMGRLEQFLIDNELRENTILVFLTDNGTRLTTARDIYNAGMRGIKGGLYDGAHRVPLFVRWPSGGIGGSSGDGMDVDTLTQVQDIAPTLLELCNLSPTLSYPMDGKSLVPLLNNEAWPHAGRMLSIQFDISGASWNKAVVLYDKWRLVEGDKLYDLNTDPGQNVNVAAANPAVLAAMQSFYNDWHEVAHAEFEKTRYADVGTVEENEVILYASDWVGDYADNQGSLVNGDRFGAWDIDIAADGNYQIELSRWPFESGIALDGGSGASGTNGVRPVAHANLSINESEVAAADTSPGQLSVTFTVPLFAGKRSLEAIFSSADGTDLCGAYYVKMTYLSPIYNTTTWTAETLTDVSRVSTNGTLLEALNFNGGVNADDHDTTINGVTFEGFVNGVANNNSFVNPTALHFSSTSDNVTPSNRDNYTIAKGGIAEFDKLLSRWLWGSANNTTLRNLEVGQRYEVQLFFGNTNIDDEHYIIIEADTPHTFGDQATTRFISAVDPSDNGLVITGTFTAIDTIQSFTIDRIVDLFNPYFLNGYQLRAIESTRPVITDFAVYPDNTVSLSWTSGSAPSYSLLSTTNLSDPSPFWEVLSSHVPGEGSIQTTETFPEQTRFFMLMEN